jgi:hypothetical protein
MKTKFFIVEKIHSNDNMSNMMTRYLMTEKFEFCIRQVDLMEPPNKLGEGAGLLGLFPLLESNINHILRSNLKV